MEEKLDSKNVELASVTKERGFHIYNVEEMAAAVATTIIMYKEKKQRLRGSYFRLSYKSTAHIYSHSKRLSFFLKLSSHKERRTALIFTFFRIFRLSVFGIYFVLVLIFVRPCPEILGNDY